MAKTEDVRGYTVNIPGRRPPWGEAENQLFKDIIQYLPDEGNYLTERHHHSNLYNPTTDTAAGIPRVSVGAGAVVINEQGDDIDLRVESDGNENFLFGDAGNDRWGMGTGTPLLNVGTAAGNFTDYTGLHVTGAGTTGLIIEGTAAVLVFADSDGAVNDKIIQAGVNNGILRFRSRNDNLATRVDNILVIDMGTGDVGMGIVPTGLDGRLHIHDATAGVVDSPANTLLTIENSASAYISGLTPVDGYFGLMSGFVGANDNGQWLYFNSTVAAERNWKATVDAVGIAAFTSVGFKVFTDGVGAIPVPPRGTIDIRQGNAAGAVPVVYLDQDDVDEAFLEFDGTVGVIATSNICTDNANGSHSAANCSGPLENWQHYAMLRCTITGVGDRWIPLYIGS